MYWQERGAEKSFEVSDEIVDLIFKLECKRLPIDHAWALSKALCKTFPWLTNTPNVGIHLVHGAETGNGWIRPENSTNAVLNLSRRTRFTLRLPKTEITQANQMPGTTVNVEGHALTLGEFSTQLLIPQTTLFSRYVLSEEHDNDDDFLQSCANQIQALDISIQKMISGNPHQHQTPNGKLFTRKLMIADLEKEESIKLQQIGIGDQQLLGIGLFLPHKGIQAVSDINEELTPFLEKNQV